jgi:hypothetical protein
MSKTKFVEFGGNGFWAYDVALGVFLKYLIDIAEASPQANSVWLSERLPRWRVIACISDFGLRLDENRTTIQRQGFIAFAEEACARLALRESIPAEEMLAWNVLDGEGISPRGASEVQTGPVIEVGRAIIALMSGELPEPPENAAWCYGFPEGRTTIGMIPGWRARVKRDDG